MTRKTADLLDLARKAAERAYAPYSRFRVGAAVAAGDLVWTGCNVENASSGLAICAERAAVFRAVAEGCRRLDRVAIACIDAPPGASPGQRMPCGACRQVLAEFAAPETPVEIDGVGRFTLAELLPLPFVLDQPR